MDSTETDDESLIGEACHIVAHSSDGPRGNSLRPPEQRDKYGNLILLCNIHHKQIDDQPDTFTVSHLQHLKNDHEMWVRQSLASYDAAKQGDDEIYADYITEWETRSFLNEWMIWSTNVLSHGRPTLRKAIADSLSDLPGWLLGRIWPCRYPQLEDSFLNFRLVLQDFLRTFFEHASLDNEKTWITDKFYQIPEWNPTRYERLSKQYDYHVGMVEDLTLELTRAGNLVCDRVREFIIPSYRIKEGVLLVQSGPYGDLSWRTHRAEYSSEERKQRPYKGSKAFESERFERNFYFGENPTESNN